MIWLYLYKYKKCILTNSRCNIAILCSQLPYSCHFTAYYISHLRAKETWVVTLSFFLNPIKVHIFWEGHKILQNHHLRFDRYYIEQIYGIISQNFVAFSEWMNFNTGIFEVLSPARGALASLYFSSWVQLSKLKLHKHIRFRAFI